MSGKSGNGTYRAKCQMDGCETRFIGISKEEYVEHLREEHSDLAARIEDELVVDPDEVASAQTEEGEGFAPTQADASGRQINWCPECEEDTDHKVWVTVGQNGDITYRKCLECDHEHVDRYMDADGGL